MTIEYSELDDSDQFVVINEHALAFRCSGLHHNFKYGHDTSKWINKLYELVPPYLQSYDYDRRDTEAMIAELCQLIDVKYSSTDNYYRVPNVDVLSLVANIYQNINKAG